MHWEVDKVNVGPRKWRRMLSQSVRNSIVKTLTEPITNSWDSYKAAGSLDQSSALVGKFMALRLGGRVEHSQLVKGIRPKNKRCRIEIQIATTKTTKLNKRQCRIIDQAEGMAYEQLGKNFVDYGEEKSQKAYGKGGRGLFGQGATEVLFGHNKGEIATIKDGTISFLEAIPDRHKGPSIKRNQKKASLQDREQYGITESGTCISFSLDTQCHIPDAEVLYKRLSNFFMLRLINADPCCETVLTQFRSDRKRIPERLRYCFPTGTIVGTFISELRYLRYGPVKIECVVARSDVDLIADASDLDSRENGLLVVDEDDVVYDCTLFDFDKSQGIERLFGIVKLTGFREIVRDRLNNHDEAIITESRDGLDERRDFTKKLNEIIRPHLKSIVEAEQKRIKKQSSSVPSEIKERFDKALDILNTVYAQETGEKGDDKNLPTKKELPHFNDVTFWPFRLSLSLGVPRHVYLLAKKDKVKATSSVLLESQNSDIVVEAAETLQKAKSISDEVIALACKVISSSIGASGEVNALVEGVGGESFQASFTVLDVKIPTELEPPKSGLEFRPKVASADVQHKGVISLFVNLSDIPAKAEILIRIEETDSAISLISPEGTEVVSLSTSVLAAGTIENELIGKIMVRFRGHGKGERATLVAKAKVKAKGKYQDTAEIRIVELQPEGPGLFKTIEYDEIEQPVACDLDKSSGTLYINSKHPVNKTVFGEDAEDFSDRLKNAKEAQVRLYELLMDLAMFQTLTKKCELGGRHGWSPSEHDPVGSVRVEIEAFKLKYGLAVYKALVVEGKISEFTARLT